MAEQINLDEMRNNVNELLDSREFGRIRVLFTAMEPADIAELLGEIDEQRLPILFRILPKELAAETFVEMDSDEQELLINAFSERELHDVVEELFVDDAVDIIEEMPANVVKRILRHTDSEMRNSINEILRYPKDSAGSIMTTEYVSLKKDMTVSEAFDRIRRTGVDKETIYTCYVTDTDRKLIGLVTVKELLLSPYNTVINTIMEKNIISVETLDDKEEVVVEAVKAAGLTVLEVNHQGEWVSVVAKKEE